MLKNKKLTKKDLCDKWFQDKNINPETKRKIMLLKSKTKKD